MIILMDIDGVLIDSKKLVYECYKEALNKFGIALTSPTFVEKVWGNNWFKAAEQLGLGTQQAEQVHAEKSEVFKRKRIEVDPRIKKLLTYFLGDELVFITAGSEEDSKLKVEALTVHKYKLITSFDKTDIRNWLYIFDTLSLDPKECIVIDDCEKHCEIAKHLGALAINWKLV